MKKKGGRRQLFVTDSSHNTSVINPILKFFKLKFLIKRILHDSILLTPFLTRLNIFQTSNYQFRTFARCEYGIHTRMSSC